jgi:TctA family transporter
MRTALLVSIVAGWLLAQTGSAPKAIAVAALQAQVSDIAKTLVDIRKNPGGHAKADLRFER